MTVELLSNAPTMGSVFARAALSPLTKRGMKPVLPEQAIGLDGARSDRKRLSDYVRVCGFSEAKYVPATWIHILAFPLHGALMTSEAFPFPMIGLVHITNVIKQLRPIAPDEAVDIRARLGGLAAHDKGLLFSIYTDVSVRGEKVWEEEGVMLRRGRFPNAHVDKPKAAEDDVPVDAPENTERWPLPEDLGRRYGRASGDMNPIHLHALTAKAFGFPRAIAHGMWTQARALAALSAKIGEQPFSFSTHFKLPAFLPGEVTFRTQSTAHGTRFEVRDKKGDKPHARGQLNLL